MKTSSPRTAVMKEEMTHTQSVDQAVNMFMSVGADSLLPLLDLRGTAGLARVVYL